MSKSADASNSSRYFKLGIFMLAGIVLLVSGIIVLGAGALFSKTVPAETLVYESVNGLDIGSAVKYRGVPVGKVTAIIFASAKYSDANTDNDKAAGTRDIRGILIEMALNEKAFPHESEKKIIETAAQLVAQGLRARVTPAGISGQSYIDCDILDPADHPPPPINWKPDILYIPSAPSSIGQVLDAAGQIASQLQKANLGIVVRHLDELLTQSTATVGELKQVVANNRNNFSRTIAQLPDAASGVKSTIARADQILRDPRIEKAMNGLSSVGDSADGTLADIRRLVRAVSALLDGESDDVRSILTDLRRLARDGAAVADDARQNPSRLLFGQPPPPDQPSPVSPRR